MSVNVENRRALLGVDYVIRKHLMQAEVDRKYNEVILK